jgi:hypothetical protein
LAGVSLSPEVDVAETLQQLRSGVRQRVAELAAVPADAGGTRSKLLEVRAREFVREPTPVSHRGRVGGGIVWTRKVFYHLFLKWFARPVLEQQNAFNQAASAVEHELAARLEEMQRRLELLQHRVEHLEHGPPPGEGSNEPIGKAPAGR